MKDKIIRIEVEASSAGRRLDVFLADHLEGVSRAKVKDAIEQGLVTVGQAKVQAKLLVKRGQIVEVVGLAPQAPSILQPVAMPLTILFEDKELLVVSKPIGISVHPGAGNRDQVTLVQGLLHHCGKLSRPDPDVAEIRPGIVHRLDKDTSGVLVVAKTNRAHAALADQFAKKTNLREYVALLDGYMRVATVTHESYLARDPKERIKFCSIPVDEHSSGEGSGAGKFARSHFFRMEVFGDRITLARVRLETGRTHQIRVHARDLKLPVVGDLIYHHPLKLVAKFTGPIRAHLEKLARQMLHAELLGFVHPTTGKDMVFKAEWPQDLKETVELLRPYRTL